MSHNKGKVEKAVGYVKNNALVGRDLESLDIANQWLAETWCPKISDHRVLKHTGNLPNTPAARFLLEKKDLQELKFRKPSLRRETRHVDKTSLIQVDGNLYKAPEIARNKDVQILVDDRTITMRLNGEVIAELDKAQSVYTPVAQSVDEARPKAELKWVKNQQNKDGSSQESTNAKDEDTPNPIGRPMKDYELALGGNWNDSKDISKRQGPEPDGQTAAAELHPGPHG